jgi:uncharacterized protein
MKGCQKMSLWWAFPVGLSVGIISGFFGVGGGFILTPILLLLGFNPTTAVATSLINTTSTSLSGSWAHIRYKNIVWKTSIILAFSGVASTFLAFPIVQRMESFSNYSTFISILYCILLGYFTISVWKKRNTQTQINNPSPSWWKIIFIGLFGGFISTLLGVGGGFIMVPLLITLLGYESHKAIGTSLFSILFIVLSGSITYIFSTPIDLKLAALLTVGAFLGSQIGAKITNLYSSQKIQIYLGGLYLVTFLSMLLKVTFNAVTFGLGIIGLYFFFLIVGFITQLYHNQVKENASQIIEKSST